MILDTSSVIRRVKRDEEIGENVTSITLIEYPPIGGYRKFRGRVYFVTVEDQMLAAELQRRLRRAGRPLSAADLLIAAVCLNRGEELLTEDEDFLAVVEIEPSLKVVVESPG